MQFINKLKLFLVLSLALVHHVHAYSTGAPTGVCSTMVPGHGGSAQTGPSPYTISLDKSEVLGGETVKVLLKGSRPFKGFLVQGHKQLQNYGNIELPFGKFSSPTNPNVKSVNCGGVSSGGMTHANAGDKTEIELEWNAPNEEGNYVLLASFVEDYPRFWVKQVSEPIRVRKNTNVVAEEAQTSTKLSPEAESILNSYYDGCGQNKGCFGLPNGCIESRSCDLFSTFRVDGSKYVFQVSGSLGAEPKKGYVATGLSFDSKMGNDSVIACLINPENREAEVYSYYTVERNIGFLRDRFAGLRTDIPAKTKFLNNRLFCEFTRVPKLTLAEMGGTSFDLSKDEFYILMAKGLYADQGRLNYHETFKGVSDTKFSFGSYPQTKRISSQKSTKKTPETIYDECGVTKGCFGMPSYCVRAKTCEIIVTFDSEFNFQLMGKLVDNAGVPATLGHVSLGLSSDQNMGDDSVIGCTYDNGQIHVKSYYNPGYSNVIFTNPELGLENVGNQNSFIDGWLYCEFKRSSDLVSDEIASGTEYHLESDQYYILLARAGSLKESGGLDYHGSTGRAYAPKSVNLKDIVIVGEEAASTTESSGTELPSTQIPFDKIYEECGVTRGCFGMPNKCFEKKNCKLLASYNKEYVFQVLGEIGNSNTGHVSTGLSFDDKMGADSVVGCVLENGRVETRTYYNIKAQKQNAATKNTNHGLDGQGNGKYVDGWLFCEFKRTEMLKDENEEIGGDIDLANGNYHILLAKAASLGPNKLGYHELESDRGVTPEAVHMTYIGILGSKSSILTQLHGGFMIIAWLLCASTGMFTARYYKQTHTDFNPFNKAFWFVVHVTCMFSTVFLTICGIIFIFIEVGGYSEIPEGPGKAHPILGFILLGLAVTQVIIAFFRPHPGTKKRPIFNWLHWTIGNSAHIVGIACIFLARELSKAGLKDQFWFPLVAFVIFHVGMHVAMSIHTVWADKRMDAENKMRAVRPGPMKPSGKAEEAPGAGFRSFMLILYLVGAALVGIILVLQVAKVY